jgi:hypothetical protein
LLQVLLMPINKGGRGKRSPYATKVVRIPDPLLKRVEELVNNFYEDEKSTDDQSVLSDQVEFNQNREESVSYALDILAQNKISKKSTKHCLEKLLQVLYNDNSIKL